MILVMMKKFLTLLSRNFGISLAIICVGVLIAASVYYVRECSKTLIVAYDMDRIIKFYPYEASQYILKTGIISHRFDGQAVDDTRTSHPSCKEQQTRWR
jgi:hypothetical protein